MTITSRSNDDEERRCEATASFRTALQAKERKLAHGLLDGPVDVNYVGPDGTSLLMAAAYRGYAEVCRRLVDLGADASYAYEESHADDESQTFHGEWQSALTRAKASGDAGTIDFVERAFVRAHWKRLKALKKEDLSWYLYAGPTFLRDAARLGMMDVCADMASDGLPLEEDDPVDNSPATAAADKGQFRTAVLLLALGADVRPLMYCESIPMEVRDALHVIGEHMKRVDPDPSKAELGQEELFW